MSHLPGPAGVRPCHGGGLGVGAGGLGVGAGGRSWGSWGRSRRSEAAMAAAAAPGSGARVIGRPITRRSAPASMASSGVATRAWSWASVPAGRTPGVMSVTPWPTSDRTAATSRGEQTSPCAPASTESTASRRTASETGPSRPMRPRSSSLREVSTVTAATSVPGAASTAARITSGPPAACTVSTSGRSLATARAAPLTVAGMSWSLRSRNTATRLAPRTVATTCGPYRRYSSSPTLTVLTYGVTMAAHRAAVSRSGASRATATGAGLLTATPPNASLAFSRVAPPIDDTAPLSPPGRTAGEPALGPAGSGRPVGAVSPGPVGRVGLADDVGRPVGAEDRQFLFQLAQDARAGRRVVQDRGAHADRRGAREHQLERVAAAAHTAGPDDRHVGEGLPDLPDTPHRDRPDRRAGQPAVRPGQRRAHGFRVDGHAEQHVNQRQPVRARRDAGPGHRDDVGHIRR